MQKVVDQIKKRCIINHITTHKGNQVKFRNILIAASAALAFSASAQTYKDELLQCALIAKQVEQIRKAIDHQDLIQAVYLQDAFQQTAQTMNMQDRYTNAVHTGTTRKFESQAHLVNFLMLECTH